MKPSALLLLFSASLAQAAPPVAFEITPKTIERFEAPLSVAEQKLAAIGKNPPVASARCAIAVPAGFTPARAWPILIWNSPQDASAIDALARVAPAANEAGWIALAAEGSEKAKVETTEWCAAMLMAAFDQLERSWPGVRGWTVAAGGFSGGGKRAPYIGAMLMENRYRVTGLFLGGVNEERASDALKWHKPGAAYYKLPIFVSGALYDETATPEMQHAVVDALLTSGFQVVRFESYGGGHDLNPQHITDALHWFANPVLTPRR